MKKKRLIAAALVIAVLAAAAAVRYSRKAKDDGMLMLSGNVEVTEVNVAFKMPGRVAALYTDEGRDVARGERLAVLDNAEYLTLVAQNRAGLRTNEAQLDKATKDLERYEVLYRKEAISGQQMDAARTGYDAARAQTEQAAAALRSSEVRLGDTVLSSPLTGTVLRKNIEAGETIAAGTPVFTLGDLQNPWIRVYVKEDRLGLVKLGQKARISTDSYPGKYYEGTVTYISSEAEFTPKTVQTQEERVKLVFAVKVSVRNDRNELKPGMPADVRIDLK